MRMFGTGRLIALAGVVLATAAACGGGDPRDDVGRNETAGGDVAGTAGTGVASGAGVSTPGAGVAETGASSEGGVSGAAPTQGAQAGDRATGTAAPFGRESEGNIASTLRVVNRGEIEAGQLAVRRATSNDIRAFARDMVTEHTAMLREVDALVKSKGFSRDTSSGPNALETEMSGQLERLTRLSGTSFDSAYASSQVEAHQQALSEINRLAGVTQNAELRAALQAAAPKVRAHLDRASALATSLGSGSNRR